MTKPVAEIVAELRKMDGSSYASQIMQEAASELTRLSEENERFRKALNAIKVAPGGGPGRRIAFQVLGEL